MSTGGAQSEQDATEDDSQRDAASADDTKADDTQDDEDNSPPDVQEPSDASNGADGQDEDDANTNPDATDPGDDADAEDDADAGNTLPAGSCNNPEDCQATGGNCVEPGGFVGCGACHNFLVTCADDSDCGPGSSDGFSSDVDGTMVCKRVAPEDCACSPDISICKPACQDNSDCKEGQTCNRDGHCAATPCSPTDDTARACPYNFKCETQLACDVGEDCQICERIACDQDSECGVSGVCVNGACHADLGTCQFPPP